MSADLSDVEIEAIVPAAGRGRRMGSAKQTLPYRGATFAASVVTTLLDAGAVCVTVVTRRSLVRDLALPAEERIKLAFNEDADSEMIESIRIGLTAIATARTKPQNHDPAAERCGIAVVPADMPALSVSACRLCFRAFVHDPRRIVLATCSGRRGHPIVFPYALRDALDDIESGLNQLPALFSDRVHFMETDDATVALDIDTPQDLDKLNASEPGTGKTSDTV